MGCCFACFSERKGRASRRARPRKTPTPRGGSQEHQHIMRKRDPFSRASGILFGKFMTKNPHGASFSLKKAAWRIFFLEKSCMCATFSSKKAAWCFRCRLAARAAGKTAGTNKRASPADRLGTLFFFGFFGLPGLVRANAASPFIISVFRLYSDFRRWGGGRVSAEKRENNMKFVK